MDSGLSRNDEPGMEQYNPHAGENRQPEAQTARILNFNSDT
jgi:hypothetical protein